MAVRLLSLYFFVISISISAQKVDFYPDNVFPANPNGGKEELAIFFKQRLVYPNIALKNEQEGQVSILFTINPNGQVSKKRIGENTKEDLVAFASQIFDEIVWTKNDATSGNAGQFNEVVFHFDVKKYQKLVKKRGYENLPYPEGEIDNSSAFYTINQVDVKPQISNGKNVNQFVSKNFKYPSIALQRNISGRVSVEFIIEPYGLISNLRIIESVPGGCDEETKRLVRKMKWTPGKKDGKWVRTLYRYDLNFVHPGNNVR